MILLTTDEARIVHAVLEFGAPVLGLVTESDREHFARARAKLSAHSRALAEMIAASTPRDGKEPA